MDWNDLRFVLAICQEGTLSGAARKLNVNHSTVFRRINAIEEMLEVRLFERLQNGYAMTEAGEAALEAATRIDDEVSSLSRKLVGRDLRLYGKLRVTAPDALALTVLMPHLADFSKAYPDIQLELAIANGYFSLTQREADIAVRATHTPPDTAVGRRICTLATSVYGSKTYLAANANSRPDQYSWLMPDDELSQLPTARWMQKHYAQAPVLLRSNSILGLYEAVRQDCGVAPLPCFLGDRDGALKRVLDPPDELASELWLLTHPELRRTARVRAFTDYMADALGKEVALIEGNLAV